MVNNKNNSDHIWRVKWIHNVNKKQSYRIDVHWLDVSYSVILNVLPSELVSIQDKCRNCLWRFLVPICIWGNFVKNVGSHQFIVHCCIPYRLKITFWCFHLFHFPTTETISPFFQQIKSRGGGVYISSPGWNI